MAILIEILLVMWIGVAFMFGIVALERHNMMSRVRAHGALGILVLILVSLAWPWAVYVTLRGV